MNKKITVLHVISDSNIGGAGKLLYNLSACIDRNKFEFVFIFPQRSKLCELFADLDFTIYTICYGKDRSFDIRSLRELKKLIKFIEPDIVHTHSSLAARMAARLCGVPKARNVYTRHCVFGVPKFMRLRIIKFLYRSVDDLLCNNIIAVANSAKRELVNFGVRAEKIDIVINGSLPLKTIDKSRKNELKTSLGIRNGEFVVGISARLEKYKGHEFFIKAAAISKRNNDNIRFVIMGDGSYREALVDFSKKLGVDKGNSPIIFTGFVSNVNDYMNIFDVNVNCSIGTETSSLSISEGLSLGIPAIVSNYGGNPNMIKNKKTGLVIEPASPDDLYNAICVLKNNNEIYKSAAMAAKKDFFERFSAESMAKKYESIYIRMFCSEID